MSASIQAERTTPGSYLASVGLAVAYVVSFFFMRFLLVFMILPVGPLIRWLGLFRLCRRYPALLTLISSLSALTLSVVITSAFGQDGQAPLAIALLVPWIICCHVLHLAGTFLSPMPRSLADLDETVAARWPEKWFAKKLRKSRDAFFVRFVINGSFLMAPVWVGVVHPELFSVMTCIQFLVAWEALGFSHETLDHTNLHNRIFRPRADSGAFARFTIGATNWYIRFVLDSLCVRIPNYYRVQHLYIHHVENNGLGDIHTTLLYDRLSFFDFCRSALRKGLSLLLAWDVYRYLVERKRHRQIRLLLAGLVSWGLLIGGIALIEWRAAVFILAVRFYFGIYHAMTNFAWHALVDSRRPENAFGNSVNLIVENTHGNLGAVFHIEHHLLPGEHWSTLCERAQENRPKHAEQGSMVLWTGAWMGFVLLSALWLRRYDLIENYIVIDGGERSGQGEFEQSIWERTRPIVDQPRPDWVCRLDRVCGALVVKYLLRGVPPVKAAKRIAERRIEAVRAATA